MQIQHSQYNEHTSTFKSLIETVMTYQLPQLKLYLVNVQKKIQAKQGQFYSQYQNLTSLLNQTKQAKGKVVLHFACARGDVSIVKLLIQQYKADYNIKDKEGNNMFFTSIEHGHIDLVKFFIEKLNVSVNSTKQGQISTLHVAANSDNVELIEYLFKKGANIEKLSIYGKPINWAVGNSHVSSTIKLLELGADPNGDLTCQAPAPIILAIDFNSKEIYDALMNKKCSLQVKDPLGYSLLHVAAQKGQLQMVKDLIERGLQKQINNEVDGKTPLQLAFENDKWNVISYLKDHTHKADEISKKIKENAEKNNNKSSNNPEKIITQQDKIQADKFKNQGNKFFAEKKYVEALEQYKKAFEFNPKNEIINRNMAACYLPLERYQEALESCMRAKQVEQKNVKTLYRQAQAHIGLKNYIEGASSLWQCYLLEPKNTFFYTQFNRIVAIAKNIHQAGKNKKT